MKIVTIIKQVPDAEARLRPGPDGVDLSGVTFVMDGMDEYGVEEALRIREAGADTEVVAVALGPSRCEEALRTALAMGADRAVHVEAEVDLDPVAQARVLAQVVTEVGAELVLVGGKQADWDSSALGPAVAEALGWPHSDWTTELKLVGRELELVHDTDEGSEELTVTLPAVVTTQQGLNEPRYPTLPNIMKAKRKELRKVPVAELADVQPTRERISQTLEERKRRNELISGDPSEAARELLRRLREDAGVLPK